ncbi:hypothetical protein [Pseudomarimonas arenosa]|uniref:Alginate export domain-containing protein n=1 Tax=Pseudomarimonas arenosa TaxID=2774145 RepID=A0AAW3ZLR3_9GAMM|nr:hypothetical protein [Pseudomarimonas arenosa]MBD8525246.1 hypothetical protein [Pseudomarimonas arenosa]
MSSRWRSALALVLAAGCGVSQAQDEFDDWQDWDDPSLLSGYLEYRSAQRFDRNPLFPHRASRDELKLKLEASDQADRLAWDVQLDLYADSLEGRLRSDLREASLSFTLTDRAQFKLGRQVLGWGTGDLLFVNDRFPKDFVAPLSGGDDANFKVPSNTLRLLAGLGPLNVDLAYTPRFTSDRFPDGRRLSLFDPTLQRLVGGSRLLDPEPPNNSETALRLARSHNGIEYAAYAYRGFDKQPLSADRNGAAQFRRRDTLGASVRGPLWGGIASAELGRERRRDGAADDSVVVPDKSAIMLGFERELRAKLSGGVQLYHERFDHHPRALNPFAQGQRQLISLRLTQSSMQDRLQLSAIQFYSPDRHDRWLRGTASYRFSDDWLAGVQLNLFGGLPNTLFGQFTDDSQLGLWLRRQF